MEIRIAAYTKNFLFKYGVMMEKCSHNFMDRGIKIHGEMDLLIQIQIQSFGISGHEVMGKKRKMWLDTVILAAVKRNL